MDPSGKSDVKKRSSCDSGTKYLESLPPFMLLSQFPLVHSLPISFVQKLVESSTDCPKVTPSIERQYRHRLCDIL